MDLRFYLEKLHSSDEYQDFMLENPDAYLCSGFFVMDFEKANHQRHLDFYAPALKKVFSFKMENGIERVPIDTFDETAPRKLSVDYDFNLDEIESLIRERMEQEKVRSRIQKVLLSLQNFENKDLLTATVFVSGLGMLKINLDPVSKKILDFDRKSFFDMLKIVRKK